MIYNEIDVRNIGTSNIDYQFELCNDEDLAVKYIKFIEYLSLQKKRIKFCFRLHFLNNLWFH